MRKVWTLGLVVGALACGGSETAKVIKSGEQYNDTAVDESGPDIDHTPITTSQQYEQPVALTATVTDDGSGVDSVVAWYKRANEVDWSSVPLEASGDLWQGAIPGAEVTGSGMDYYLEAVDELGNSATEPVNGAADAFYFRISGD